MSHFQFNPRAPNPIQRAISLAARTMRSPLGHHAIMAQRYSDWAQQQVDRANQTLNPKARNDRLALAQYYSQLAERELVAAKRLEAAVGPPQIQANTFPASPRDGSSAVQHEGTLGLITPTHPEENFSQAFAGGR